MADSIKKRIIAALDTVLKTILISNGYSTNAGQNVYDWITQNLPISSLPAYAYKNTGDTGGRIVTIAGPVNSIREYILNLDVNCIAQGSTTRSQIRDMMADLMRAIGTDQTFGGLALYTEFSGDETAIEQQEETVGSTTVKIAITYRTKIWDTTNQ